MKPIIIDLGPVRLSFAVGDADHNGCLDFSVGFRLKGLFEINPPPVNLDLALAQKVAAAFKAVGDFIGEKLGGKKG